MANKTAQQTRQLYELAHLYGVQTSYYDAYQRQRRRASAGSLIAILRSLDAGINTLADIPAAIRQRRLADWQRALEPVVVAWSDKRAAIELRLPHHAAGIAASYHLKLETGETREGRWAASDGAIVQTETIEGTRYITRRLPLAGELPYGYHHLAIELPGRIAECLIISAPPRAYSPPPGTAKPMWGVFLPLYALRTEDDWGSGDYSGLEKVMDWVGDLGGNVVGTLPLLASLRYKNGDFRPYLPSSRLFWNDLYIDVTKIPDLRDCPRAGKLMSSGPIQKRIAELRAQPLVEYSRVAALKRRVLDELSQHFFSIQSDRLDELWRFAGSHPSIEDYARFCATLEKRRRPWRTWPEALRDGAIRPGDYDEDNLRYHVYVQWLAHQQTQSASKSAGEKGLRLYLDLPLGTHPDGYDVWRHKDLFMSGVTVGAPPDTVFTGGQNWTFPPLNPQKIREQGYRYVTAYLRHHLECAGILRIDHVMGVHRLFCIPEGMPSSQGVYVKYPAEEFYAILSLESQRHQTLIVGEDLGNVPRAVRPAMKRHGLNRMYILRYELAGDIRRGLRPVPPASVASLNTHDMHPFASFWQGLEIEERLKLGLLDESHARAERNNLPNIRRVLSSFLRHHGWLREPDDNVMAVLRACLSAMAASPARLVLVNLEDLWLETRPQNVPSTLSEYPNWRHKMRVTFEEFCQMPEVVDILKAVGELRGAKTYARGGKRGKAN